MAVETSETSYGSAATGDGAGGFDGAGGANGSQGSGGGADAGGAGPRVHYVSRHSRIVRLQERIAKGFLWSAAGITILVLALIVGYIVVNGFYTRSTSAEPVFPLAQSRTSIPGAGASAAGGAAAGDGAAAEGAAATGAGAAAEAAEVEFAVVANGSLRLNSLSYDEARTIFSGEDLYLGYLTGQDRSAVPVAYDDEAFLRAVASYLFREAGEATTADDGPTAEAGAGGANAPPANVRAAFSDELQLVDTREAAVEALQEAEGGVALVPAEWLDSISGPRTVPILQTSIAVHPDILELQAGRRLNNLEPEQVRALISGEAATWDAVGGPRSEIRAADRAAGDEGEYEALPVTRVLFGGDSVLARRQQGLLTGVLDGEAAAGPVEADGVDAGAAAAEGPAGGTGADAAGGGAGAEAAEGPAGGTGAGAAGGGAAANTIFVETPAEFAEALRTTPGAIGVVSRDIALARELPVVEVLNTESSLNLRPSFFVSPPRRAGAVGGVSTIILNTLAMIAFVLLIATPIGVAGAIYLVEYAKQGRLLTILRIGTDTLAGIPSIVFGLFGLVFFAQFLGFQTGLISGTLTLTLMILPTVVRTSEEALRAVSRDIREGSLALGATKLQTIFRVVLPSAAPGILTGMILGIGRAVGETAALLYTMGSNLALIRSFNSPIRVLSIHLYLLVRETISLPNAFAAATILVIIVIIVNYLTRSLIGRMTRMSVEQ